MLFTPWGALCQALCGDMGAITLQPAVSSLWALTSGAMPMRQCQWVASSQCVVVPCAHPVMCVSATPDCQSSVCM